ncbi:ROK family transcriptional regulator [Consotaella aegiceratis]|uniref:ROK family transcriptional regulator n=1 Tax=Consotaella aegiceratis TaxID=3097961 RepID=UPI002F3F3E1F
MNDRLGGRTKVRLGEATGHNLVHAADHNLRITLELIRRKGRLGRIDLAALTGLTPAGVGNILHRLTSEGLIRDVGGSGKRSVQYEIAPDGAYGMGIDIAGDTIEVALVNLAGEVVHRDRCEAASSAPDAFAKAVRDTAFSVAARLSATASPRLLGIGLAAPDTLGADQLAVLTQSLAPFAVQAERDTTAAVLAERRFGAGGHDGSFVHILLRDRIRAGFLINDTVYEGVTRSAGRIGDMHTGEDGRPLDEVAAIADLSPELARAGEKPSSGTALPGCREDAIEAWLAATSEHLLDAIVALAGLIAPGTVFIGGVLSDDLNRRLVEHLNEGRAERMTGPVQPRWLPEIAASSVGIDAVLLGAAILPFLHRLLPDPRRPSGVGPG